MGTSRYAQAMGWLGTPTTTATLVTNGAAIWGALSFVADSARTLSAARAYVSAVNGTLGASDITCSLYDSSGSSGSPGSAIESGKLPSATITAAGWYNFTGFSTTLTAGQCYWLVFKNVNAGPAANNCTFRVVGAAAATHLFGGAFNSRFAWGSATTSNSGSSWFPTAGRSALRVAYADGTFDGAPATTTAAAGVGDGVYASRESGVKFTSSSYAALRVTGLAFFAAAKTGSPTGQPRLGLWAGATPSLAAYTASAPATFAGTLWIYAYFASVQVVEPGTVCRVTMGETAQSDASANRYGLQEVVWDTDSSSLALLPFGGTLCKTYFDGSSWSDTQGSLFPFALLLDSQEFQTPAGGGGGGGGLLVRRGFDGGFAG